MKNIIRKVLNFFLKFFRIRENTIIFQSGRGKVDCAPFVIYRYLKKNCKDKYRCIWLIEKGTDTSKLDDKDYLYYKSIKGIISLATAKYWIRSQSIESIVNKRKGQSYIQTWHGAGAFKKCGYDCDNNYPPETIYHARDWDFLIATDKYNEKVMISSTGYKKKSIILGNADTDLLFENNNKKYIDNIKTKLGISKNKKIILYAPTFRDFDLDKSADKINVPIFKLKELDAIILLRMHPLISKKMENLELPDNFVNVGNYTNILDLYLISDLLVTDYSSIIFPYACLKKPLVLYPYDLEKYKQLRGGFYIDYNQLPGPIVYSEDKLLDVLKDINKIKTDFKEKLTDFNNKFNYLNDGKVAKRFVDELLNGYFDK